MRIAVFRVLAATAVAWELPVPAAPAVPAATTASPLVVGARSEPPRPSAHCTAGTASAATESCAVS